MSLATSILPKLRSNFSRTAQAKGEEYARKGRVQLLSGDIHSIAAEVRGRGREPYRVEFDTFHPEEAIYAACTCPHFGDGNLCKHLWGVLIVADQRGQLNIESNRKAIKLLPDYDAAAELLGDAYEDEYPLDDEPELLYIPAQGGTPRRIGIGGKSSSGKQKDWLQELKSLDTSRPCDAWQSTEPAQQIFYLFDVTTSLRAGMPVIELLHQQQLKNGEWGKLKRLSVDRRALPKNLSAEDAIVIRRLIGNDTTADESGGYWGHFHSNTTISCIKIAPESFDVFAQLCQTERCVWSRAQETGERFPLSWYEGHAWKFQLEVRDDKKQRGWIVRGSFLRDKEQLAVMQPVWTHSAGLLIWENRLARFDPNGCSRWLEVLRKREEIRVPYAEREKLLGALWQEEGAATIVWPRNLSLPVVPGTPRGRIRIHPRKFTEQYHYAPRDVLYADVEILYGNMAISPSDPRATLVKSNEIERRDFHQEATLLGALKQAGVRSLGAQRYAYEAGDAKLPLKRLDPITMQLIDAGWLVEAEGVLLRSAGVWKMKVTSSGVDWFDLESDLDFGGACATLPELLAAAAKGQNYVALGDGSRGVLPTKWLERCAKLAEMGEVVDGKVRFQSTQGLLLDALLAEQASDTEIKVDRQFDHFRKKLRSFQGIAPGKAPRGFRGELRAYQQQGVGWLRFLEEFRFGGCLADDMGLGKTVQLLAWLLTRTHRRKSSAHTSLIVVPKSLVHNWQQEAARFTPSLKVMDYTGLGRRANADTFCDYDLIVTTYGTVRKDIAMLKDYEFDCAILDEAQAIKNQASDTAKACRLLRARQRLALSGTPIENHVGELWSLFEFLNPGMLGRSTAFRELATQVENNGESLERLRRAITPFMLRRTKQQVLSELPEKTEQTIMCELAPFERKKYDELRKHYRDSLQKRIDVEGIKKSKMHVLEALLRLRQVACHVGLIDEKLVDKSSSKLDALFEQLAEIQAEGHKALVFSQFTTLLSLVRKRLGEEQISYEYLDGKTRKRQQIVDRFQNDPACKLFLISLKAGGCGLNLTAADYVFLLDPWWNPAVEAQAIDRTHRIGQTRPVFAYRLIAADTVEEKILELQSRKRDLADALIGANANLLTSLTAEDLQLLLS